MKLNGNPTGLTTLGAYLPAKAVEPQNLKSLVNFLRSKTLLPEEYVASIEASGKLPGRIETNEEGWQNQPWYKAWVESLPPKKRENPFQGTLERRRVPHDPESVRSSLYPHPMLPSDAETIAGALALYKANISPDDVDLIMVHSQVPDRPLPQNASLLQHKLKLKNAGAYSVDSCCSSFVTMTELACSMVSSGIKKNVLVVSSFLDSHVNDKSTHFSVDTGDGAVAGLVSTTKAGFGYLASHSISHGSRHNGIIYERRSPLLMRRIDSGPDYSQLFTTFFNPEANKEIAANSTHDMQEVIGTSLNKAGLTINDIDFMVTHQPVAWAGNAWRECIGIPESKFYESFKKYGNIATAAVPTNLLEAIELRRISAGDNVIFASPGAGENHICIIMKISPELVDYIHNVHAHAHAVNGKDRMVPTPQKAFE
jgi:3-oxoacyl-[acyl-carrier-protein] synthase-3